MSPSGFYMFLIGDSKLRVVLGQNAFLPEGLQDWIFFEGAGGSSFVRTPGRPVTLPPPPVDVTRDSEEVVIKADLPGMKKEDLGLTVMNNRLFIRGEKKQETREGEGRHLHRAERFFGSFERVIDLPDPVDADRIRATFVDGVLEIHAPLREEAKPRQITVEAR